VTLAFEMAPANERTLAIGAYLLGTLELAVIAGGFAYAAWRVRALILPSWNGAPARLVESVLALAGLVWLSEALGSIGVFGEAPMIAGAIVAAALALVICGRIERREPVGSPARSPREASRAAGSGRQSPASPSPSPGPPSPPASRLAIWLAAGACAAVAAAWMVPTLASLAGGMDRADTLWYHMPLAARFTDTGDLTAIDYFDPIFFASFYPANSEIFHSIAILAFGRDILSPLLNLGWLGLGMLGCYCIGRPYGLGPQSLIAGAIALGSQQLVEFQAGEALNDIVGVALVLAAVAVLVNARAAVATRGSEGKAVGGGDVRARAPAGVGQPASAAAGGSPRAGRKAPPEVAQSAQRGEGVAQPAQAAGEPAAAGGAPPLAARRDAPAPAGDVRAPAPATGVGVPAVAVAGIAAGLAAGTKLSFLAPVLALWVGVIVIAGHRARMRTALWFALPALAAGGYWYLRNLIAIGNPIPYTSWGPLGLPTPERAFELRPGYSVFHYATDTRVWSDWFFPGLDHSFGLLWPIVLAAFIGCGAYAVWRGADPVLRVLGAVVLFTTIAYLFTPLTAAGEEGMPIAFEWNVRYLAPAAAVGLALVPCLPPARRSELARGVTLAGLCVLFVATIGSLVQWQQGHVKGAVATGVGVLVAFAVVRGLRARGWLSPQAPRRYAVGLATAVVAVALVAGWWEQNHYLERRYDKLSPQLRLADAARWARDIRDAKIAVAGVRGVFNQYPFYGTDLSNEVQWLGEKGADGAYLRIPTCAEWRRALDEGDYTHVVTTYDPFQPGSLTDTKEGLWTRVDPASRQILRDGPVSVFELRGKLDPAACDGLPDLSPAELNGDSVNTDPTANQPLPDKRQSGAG
jgi:hypothetical protein